MTYTYTVGFAGSGLAIDCEDAECAAIVEQIYRHQAARATAMLGVRLRLSRNGPIGGFALQCDGSLVHEAGSAGEVARALLGETQRCLAEGNRSGLLLHAACVSKEGRGVILPGQSGAGKTTLAAWLSTHGFEYLSDELVFVRTGSRRVEGFLRPLDVKAEGRRVLAPVIDFEATDAVLPAPDGFLVFPRRLAAVGAPAEADACVLIFPSYSPGVATRIEPISQARAAMLLMGCLINARNLPGHGLEEVARLARALPAYSLTYDDLGGIADEIDELVCRSERTKPTGDAAPPSHAMERLPSARSYAARRPGFLLVREGEDYFLQSRRQGRRVRLNPTGAFLWLLCDGGTRVEEIVRRVEAQYPDAPARIRADVLAALRDLAAEGLVRIGAHAYTARPSVRVGFSGFWPAFDPRDNYFSSMLAERFDVVLVDPRGEMPDLLFYSTRERPELDHRRVDRRRTFKVFFGFTPHSPDFGECDFAFTTEPVEDRHRDRHCRVPAAALFVDWNVYRRSRHGLPPDRLLEEADPAKACNRLVAALVENGAQRENVQTKPTATTPRANQGAAASGRATVAPAAAGSSPKLTIGMATFDDFDGVYFTVQAIRLHHPEVAADTEILIVDNDPAGPCADALRQLSTSIAGCRYVANADRQGTASRDLVFREARTPYAMCVDSHVLFPPGAIRGLVDYFERHPDTRDLLQGPLLYDDLRTFSTHFDPVWSAGMYGVWGTDQRGADPKAEPFEIAMQGLGVFACRREAWLGFNPRFSGFGGEEGYIHEKFRRAGGRALCLPFLRWVHRFHRPHGTRYPNSWEDRIRNYLIAFDELGLDSGGLEAHFREQIGDEPLDRVEREVRAEIASPFFFFDAIYCINLDSATERWERMQERFRRLGIAHRVRRFAAIETPESHHIGCALSHRAVIERAKKQGLANVLVLEDDALFVDDALLHLENSIRELRALSWRVLHLGGHKWGRQFPKVSGCRFLEGPCEAVTCTHAVAYDSSVYEKLLADLPAETDAMRQWIAEHAGIDQYLRHVEHRYLTSPVVASQPFLLAQEAAEQRNRFQ